MFEEQQKQGPHGDFEPLQHITPEAICGDSELAGALEAVAGASGAVAGAVAPDQPLQVSLVRRFMNEANIHPLITYRSSTSGSVARKNTSFKMRCWGSKTKMELPVFLCRLL